MLPALRTLLRILGVASLVLAVGLLVWTLTHRDQARGWRQAATIGAGLSGDGSSRSIVGRATREPRPARTSTAAELPATVVHPAGATGDRHPALALLVPELTDRAEEQQIAELQRSVARAGIAAWAVRVPGSVERIGSVADAARVEAALRAIVDDPTTRDEAISVAGAGSIGSQALLAAASPALRDRIRGVLAVQPVADVQGLVRLAVTGTTRDAAGADRAHPSATLVRAAAGAEIVETLEREVADAGPLLGTVLRSAGRSPDPLAALVQIPAAAYPPRLAPVHDLLTAAGPVAFDAAWARLPAGLRGAAEQRSVLTGASCIRARVLLVVPEDDRRLPAADAARIAAVIPDARVVRTPLLGLQGRSVQDAPWSEVRAVLSSAAWWLQRVGR